MSGACEYKPNYKKREESIKERKQENKKLEILRLSGIAIVIIFVAWIPLLQPIWLANIIVFLAVIICGYPIYRESFSALKKGRVNMELSMVIAIIASLILWQLLPAIAITFFALLSEFIEGFIVKKGRKNIEMLHKHTPKRAIVKKKNKDGDGHENIKTQEIPISEVIVGDIVIVREGDIIPVDGRILNGTSTIDQSSITGESMPAEKDRGDQVFAGTINLTSQLEIKCEKLATDTTFARIIHLVEEAESSKAPIQKLSDKLATRLIQFAIGLSVLTFIVTQNVVSTLSVIVVAGACGLAVGTPIALLATNSKLARKGVLVKGGLYIENLKNAGVMIFDKTGTLTVGKPVVSQIISFDQSIEPKNVLEYAAIAEKNVNHPLANAIVDKAIEERVEVDSNNIQYSRNSHRIKNNSLVQVGRGVAVSTEDGHRISVGNWKFMEEQSSVLGENNEPSHLNLRTSLLSNAQGYRYFVDFFNQNPRSGRRRTQQQQIIHSDIDNNNQKDLLFDSTITTNAFVSLDRRIIGCILLEDKLRNEAKDALSKIKSMGIDTVMLTGDNENVAKRIAEEAGIDKYYANLLPQDKVSKIDEIVGRQYQERKKKTVIMVGDGINDAPALAKADVGIAMGKTGTDIAVETADVVLLTEDLSKLPYLLRASRQSFSAIRQNLFGTLFVDGLGFVLAFVGVLNPLLAAIVHVSSELIFIANSSKIIIDK